MILIRAPQVISMMMLLHNYIPIVAIFNVIWVCWVITYKDIRCTLHDRPLQGWIELWNIILSKITSSIKTLYRKSLHYEDCWVRISWSAMLSKITIKIVLFWYEKLTYFTIFHEINAKCYQCVTHDNIHVIIISINFYSEVNLAKKSNFSIKTRLIFSMHDTQITQLVSRLELYLGKLLSVLRHYKLRQSIFIDSRR